MCVEQTGEEKIKLEDTDYDNNKDYEQKPRISPCGFFWDGNPNLSLDEDKSSDSEDEVEEKAKFRNKKLSDAERREQGRQKEGEIRQRVEVLANKQLPNSVDRLVLASPDSLIVWLQYMAYHLQRTEIEKPRAIARRAAKTINFREENEILNVWNAWLNLESEFGIPKTLNNVFREAVRSNDSLKIHMSTVPVEAGRQMELEKRISTMIAKFKRIPETWFNCGGGLLKMGLKDRSRHIPQRALQSLPAFECKKYFLQDIPTNSFMK
ncbi:protein RRP5 homolog [Bombus fervidus]|uniref:protein RRP5 homolog n=1 Tax=Bombus fervidus TaxID=203811 RepID=UPI003AB675C7